MKIIDIIASILLIIGGLNWGIVGLFDVDIVQRIAGGTGIDTLIYVLVGLAAIWSAFCLARCCHKEGCTNPDHHHNDRH